MKIILEIIMCFTVSWIATKAYGVLSLKSFISAFIIGACLLLLNISH